MKKTLCSILLVVALLALASPAMAWNGGVNAERNCDGVTVTANPENPYWEDRSGRNQVKWVVTSVSGTGFYPWGGANQLEGDVVVTWKKQVSDSWGVFWQDAGPTHQESYHWSKNKPGNCSPPEILKIDVCHSTASETNPYVLINVNINSVADANNVGGHGQDPNDIWAPYTYKGVNYPGQGDLSILANGCKRPATSTPTPTNTTPPSTHTPTPTNTPTNTPPPTATNTVEPSRNWASIEPEVDCDGNWTLNLNGSVGAVVTGQTEGNLGTGSVHYSVDVTFSQGVPGSFHFEGDLYYPSEECSGDDTPTPTPTTTGTLLPTSTPTPPPGCRDIDAKWSLHGILKDANGNVLSVPGGNFYTVFFKMVWLENGVVVSDLGMQDFPVFDNGTFSNGFKPYQNFDRLSVVVMDATGKMYPAQAWSIHSETKQRLTDQQQYIGTYCAEMWLEVVLTDGQMPPPPAVVDQPTPAPIPDTGAAGTASLFGFVVILVLVGGVISLLVFVPKRRTQ